MCFSTGVDRFRRLFDCGYGNLYLFEVGRFTISVRPSMDKSGLACLIAPRTGWVEPPLPGRHDTTVSIAITTNTQYPVRPISDTLLKTLHPPACSPPAASVGLPGPIVNNGCPSIKQRILRAFDHAIGCRNHCSTNEIRWSI